MPSSTATTKQKAYLGGRLQLLERGGYKFLKSHKESNTLEEK